MSRLPVRPPRRALLLAPLALAGCGGEEAASLAPIATPSATPIATPLGPPPLPQAVPPPDPFALPAADSPPDATLRAPLPRGAGPLRAELLLAGQRLAVTLTGLGVEGRPPARATLAGRVFRLSRLEDIAGRYGLIGTGAAIAEMAMEGGLTLGNPARVVLRLRLVDGGEAALTLPQGALTVALAR